MRGKVKFFNDKGFGFIKADGLKKDVFFHKTGLVRGYDPQADDEVEFTLLHEERGDKADDVRKI
jgi:cold shock CspA family protein